MTNLEWFQWKKRVDPTFVIPPTKEEQDKYVAEEWLRWETEEKQRKDKIKEDRQWNFDVVPCC